MHEQKCDSFTQVHQCSIVPYFISRYSTSFLGGRTLPYDVSIVCFKRSVRVLFIGAGWIKHCFFLVAHGGMF